MKDDIAPIYGKHAVLEALTHRPDVVRVVHVTDESLPLVAPLIAKHPILKKVLNLKKLPSGVPSDAVHQGFVAEIDTSELMMTYEEYMEKYPVTNDTAVVIMGEVQDPHNVGAVIRSAVAFGLSAVFIPEHRQAQVTGSVIKVSVGTAFRIPLVRIGNINQTVENLKGSGFWVYGLAGEADQLVSDEMFEKPTAIILGNEGDGIRKKTLEHCDIPLRIPISKNAESLNASVAAGVVFYAWSTRHPKARN